MLEDSQSYDRAGDRNGLDIEFSERYCTAITRTEAKNFYWGFISLPSEQRIAIYALYAFAREIDDEVDDQSRSRDNLSERLTAQRERVRRCMRGDYTDPVMHVLSRAVDRFGIPENELQGLIDGVEMDIEPREYATWEELRGYCNLVAAVVGRMCVRIFGYRDPQALDRAEELGVALQLINVLRDVREDAAMGRIYLPREDRERFGIDAHVLRDGERNAAWHALVAFEAARALELYATGLEVVQYIPRRAGVCVRSMAGIYRGILEKILADPDRPLRERVSLSAPEKLRVVLRSWLAVR
ncbi:MAG TPA: squalene/phytoene synthase family protein [Candidatus Tyrphobacter sp.]